jgi:DNA replication protein DnaC
VNEALRNGLRQLRLSGLLESLEVRAQQAAGSRLSHLEFLELAVQDELHVRADRTLARRLKAAGFRDQKTLEDFDWSFNPSIPRAAAFDLATGRFLQQRRDCLWLGPPGVGKSHLVQAIGRQLVRVGHTVLYRSIFDLVRDFLEDETFGGEQQALTKYLKPDLLIIDDMGMKQLPKRSGEYLFEIVMRRHEVRSTMMTSNRPLEDWGKLLGDVPSATAILDRFLHHADIFQLTGQSYRLRPQSRENHASTTPATRENHAPSTAESAPLNDAESTAKENDKPIKAKTDKRSKNQT